MAVDGRRVLHPDDDELGHDQEGVGQRQVGDEQEGGLVRAEISEETPVVNSNKNPIWVDLFSLLDCQSNCFLLKMSVIERLSPVWDGIKGSSSSEVQEMTKNVGGKKVPLKKSLFFSP